MTYYHYPLLTLFISIAAAPHFSGLRRFPEGRGFKQWTGDDSKALMKASARICWHVITPYLPSHSCRYI